MISITANNRNAEALKIQTGSDRLLLFIGGMLEKANLFFKKNGISVKFTYFYQKSRSFEPDHGNRVDKAL